MTLNFRCLHSFFVILLARTKRRCLPNLLTKLSRPRDVKLSDKGIPCSLPSEYLNFLKWKKISLRIPIPISDWWHCPASAGCPTLPAVTVMFALSVYGNPLPHFAICRCQTVAVSMHLCQLWNPSMLACSVLSLQHVNELLFYKPFPNLSLFILSCCCSKIQHHKQRNTQQHQWCWLHPSMGPDL